MIIGIDAQKKAVKGELNGAAIRTHSPQSPSEVSQLRRRHH
jgi:hypothetical protein